MKIFLVGRYNPGFIKSGPEKFSKKLHEFLLNNKNHNEIYFLSFYFKELTDGTLYNRLFGFSFINKEKKIIKTGAFRLIIFLLKEKPDIVHVTSNEIFSILFYLFKLFLHYKIVSTIHSITKIELKNVPIFIRLKGSLFEKLALKYSDKIIFVSDLLQKEFQKEYKLIKNNTVINNGVDEDIYFYTNKNFDVAKELHLVFYNGFHSFINRGFNFIIQQLENLETNNIILHVIGQEVHNTNRKNIRIINYNIIRTEELNSFWKGKHFFIKSIGFDSFPIMLIEAMAAGVIPIISDNVGVKDFIKNGINGFCYSKEKIDEIFKIFGDIYTNKYDLKKISYEASSIKKLLSWDKVLKNYLKLYENI